jgi:hypothetical protein
MIPPGIPDFFSRHRIVENGSVQLFGRAWSGRGSIDRVEVGIDGEWSDAQLGPQVGPSAWRSWIFDWDATTGEHELSCRATDSTGDIQPTTQPWNHQGMGNNAAQTVRVSAR